MNNENINDEARNDVRELLNEIVVDPVSKDFEERLSAVSKNLLEELKSISSLKILISEFKKIRGTIDRIIGDDSETSISSIGNDIKQKTKELSEKIDNLPKIESINNIDQNIEKISEFAYKHSEQLHSCSVDLESMNRKLDDLRTLLDSNEQFSLIEKAISDQSQAIQQNIAAQANSLNDITTAFNDKIQTITEGQIKLHKKTKVYMIIIIGLAALNLLWIIGMMMTQLL